MINGIMVSKEFLTLANPAAKDRLIGIGDGIGCENCNGSHVVVYTETTSGPYPDPPIAGAGRAAIYGAGGWYVGESKTTPCPVCSGDKEELASLLIRSSNVPAEQRAKGLGYYRNQDMLVQVCQGMIDMLPDIHGLFTFFGSHGTGKSTAAMVVVMAACRAGVKSFYTTAQEITLGIKDTWKDPERSDQDYLDMLNRNKLLIIDEVDRVGEYDRKAIWNLVDMRYRDRDSLATILITNMDITHAPKNHEYLISRMRDGVRVPVYGEDMRHED